MNDHGNRRRGGPGRPRRPQGGGSPSGHDPRRGPGGNDPGRPRSDQRGNADRPRGDRYGNADRPRGDRYGNNDRPYDRYGNPRRDDRRDGPRRDSGSGAPRGRHRDDRRRDQRGGQDRRDRRDQAPRTPAEPPKSRTGLDPFELFCAYHLGIAPDKSYRPANVNTVARRFGVPPAEIKQALQDFGMDAGVVMEKEFDMAMAQLDMELAPEGIDRVELARPLYEEFVAARRKKIDWKKIIEEDIRENAKVFGRRD